MRINEKENHWLPVVISMVMGYKVQAVTLGSTIYWSGVSLPSLYQHEAEHVRQFQRYGFWRFLWLYWREYRRNRKAGMSKHAAYRANLYEVQARAANPYERA